MPVLTWWGQARSKSCFKFYKFRKSTTRLGKKGYAQRNSGDRASLSNSDLYALAVTALVLLTGKEPEELYDSYQGTWVWRREIVSSQLETVLQKMLYKSDARYQSAEEVLQALQSYATSPLPDANISQMRTVNFVGQNLSLILATATKREVLKYCDTHSSSGLASRPWVVRLPAGILY